MIELRGIQKYFPSNGVNALDNAEFELRPGEIHALLGENGAGKSTLMHIMAGYLKPGAGYILISGKEHHFSTPAAAIAAGIGMVRQHPHLTPGFKVWEDCILGAEPLSWGLLNNRKAKSLVQSLSERWNFDLPLDKPTDTLTVSQRQKAAILALLIRGEQYLIFDEVTAVLSPEETTVIFTLFAQLRAAGKGIVIISHKLEETLGIADRVSVLRKGKTVTTLPTTSLDSEKVRTLMFGADTDDTEKGARRPFQTPPTQARSFGPAKTPSKFPQGTCPATEGLSIRGLSVAVRGRPFIRNVDLDLPPGRVLGIAGIRDSGLETLELAVTGFLSPTAGKISFRGREISGKGPRAFRDAQGVYIGANRTGIAMEPSLRIRDNIIIHVHRRSRKGFLGFLGIMDQALLNTWVKNILAVSKIETSPRSRADSLSGGMQQRMILVREFAEDASFLVLAEPGWGLDLAGRNRLIREIKTQAGKEKGILVFSTDVDELLSFCDEILVLRNGEFSDRIPLESTEEDPKGILRIKERIGRAMIGKASYG